MKDLELFKAQFEIEQELANLNANKETSAFVVQKHMTELDSANHRGYLFEGYCANADTNTRDDGVYYC